MNALSQRRRTLLLFKTCLRRIQTFPMSAQSYYRHHVRQHFSAHRDETDAERINELLERAEQSAQWVVNKMSAQTK
ncbi:mitochondrial Complex1_LYR family protein [Andalucia godoyi]|uniref:LYR motif-containing protein 9 n=1 Tax=Andalucia godoyi TaxID=505711 RepID=A0A8K0F4G3_ANDGO|nr:mitochondrial Complex1_LYR family protein [Andalucia godoyi]|eukprot:ANDGO_08806.mRNA.1 mitochondrial Complex1_LYR family protein